MERDTSSPPKLPLIVFRWFCRNEFKEEIEGDLYERFEWYLEKCSPFKAKCLFLRDVLSLFRPRLIGNFSQLTQLNISIMIQENKRLFGIVALVFALLSVPLIAMQFSTSWDWNAFDFLVMGVLLLGTGIVCELVLRKVKSTRTRILICVVILICLFFVWAELAVGVFGSPFAGS